MMIFEAFLKLCLCIWEAACHTPCTLMWHGTWTPNSPLTPCHDQTGWHWPVQEVSTTIQHSRSCQVTEANMHSKAFNLSPATHLSCCVCTSAASSRLAMLLIMIVRKFIRPKVWLTTVCLPWPLQNQNGTRTGCLKSGCSRMLVALSGTSRARCSAPSKVLD